jgi:hypothetical protein
LPLFGTVFTFIAQDGPNIYLTNSISPMFKLLACIAKSPKKNHSTARTAFDTTSLTNTTDDTHLPSSLPVNNVWLFWSFWCSGLRDRLGLVKLSFIYLLT